MKSYRYRIENICICSDEDTLNRLGCEGWMLLHVNELNKTVIFMREEDGVLSSDENDLTIPDISVEIKDMDADDMVDDREFTFAGDNFNDVNIYTSDNLIVDFSGFDVENEELLLKISAKNTSDTDYKIRIKDLCIDRSDIADEKIILTSKKDGMWTFGTLPLIGTSAYKFHEICFRVNIRDAEEKDIFESAYFMVYIDYDNKKIKTRLRR